MNKVLNFMSKNKIYFITFGITTILISILFILNHVTPFGGKSLLCVDFFHQYGPMLGELRDRILSGKSLLYSFNLGLGIPFFRNFLNYMSSPFNIIILCFSKKNLLTSYSFIIGLRAVFASVTMVYYLSKKFKCKNLAFIPIGILYSLSAYFSAYYWNIMWMDGMVFLPLITLGIEYIVNEHKWKFYTIWLAIMLISNYFIGYMICIFSLLYFIIYSIYKLKLEKAERKKSIVFTLKGCLMFAASSLIAGMIASIFLIPMYHSISTISATGDSWPTSQYYKFTTEDFLKYHFSGVTTTVFSSDPINAPNISAGIISIALFLLFIFNKNISIKTKACYLSLLSFFILAFFWVPLDYILQAFHVPNDLPYRYSFIYTFIFLIIGAYAIFNIKKISFKLVLSTYLGLMLILILMFFNNWIGTTNEMILLNIMVLTGCFIIYCIFNFRKKFNTILVLILILIAGSDAVISVNYNWDISQIVNVFYEKYGGINDSLNYINSLKNDKFYRVENIDFLTYNDPSWYGYYGINTFSSMAYESLAKLQHNIGIPGNTINSYYYSQTTPIYDLMFDVVFTIGNTNDKKRYLTLKNNVNLFTYNIGLGFGVSKQIKLWNCENYDPFDIQNDFIKKATGITDVLYKLEEIKSEEIFHDENQIIIKYIYTNPLDNAYFYTNTQNIDYFVIGDSLYYANEEHNDYESINPEISYYSFNSYLEPGIININTSENEFEVIVAYNTYYGDQFLNYDNYFEIYTIDNEKFIDAYNYLKQYKLNITDFTEDTITGNITLDDNMIVYTSIPYDEGWKVYVDNKEIKTFKLGGALLGFSARKGTHEIKFKYIPKGLIPGTIISSIGILIFIGISLIEKFRNKKNALE